MNGTIKAYFEELYAADKNVQYEAYNQIMIAIDNKVDWAYEVWDELKESLKHKDNHERSRAAQFLCGLAKSDPENRMLQDFSSVWEVTKDKKFVTARHSLQSIWKIGLAGSEQKALVLDHFSNRFINGTDEKNYTLIRFDMIQGLRNLYDVLNDEGIKKLALDLIEKEEDVKYKKKYTAVWKNT
ncbi:hypothetical protein [Oceanobacillus bengalensis]|uniref:HEAT repeat domain-containing protein n=1 Tax=Oceanobacillus bengalensis TaxID=1435466 RepID=A0A494Z7U1_9BACI|nr:hypothetical protein [Oceanobacillus bengalensis]RKQ18655.1 hypothetical protein D8M05_00640 [Oceanobacillus bengalensis]